jgi:Ca2+-binding EF-hand superfamily protein
MKIINYISKIGMDNLTFFRRLDVNNDGDLTIEEFIEANKANHFIHFTEDECRSLFKFLDPTSDGSSVK